MSNYADGSLDPRAGRAARLARVRGTNAILVILTVIAVGACSSVLPSPHPAQSPPVPLRVVAIGDSIPNNSPSDCPGCWGFVDRYAAAIRSATKRPVAVLNLSEHTGLTLPGLLDELPTLKSQLGAADIIVVGIAHNSMELGAERPCGGAVTNDLPDWSRLTPACAKAAAAKYQPQFDTLFTQVAASRAGKLTVLRTINQYNDWIGWTGGVITPAQGRKTIAFFNEWNTMLCRTAEQHGFRCADIYHAFNGPDGSTASGNLLAKDYTHLSSEGNAKAADVLVKLGYQPLI